MNKQRPFKMAYDGIVIASILVIAAVSYGIIGLAAQKSSDGVVVVRQNNIVKLKLTEEEMKKGGIYDFKFDGGSGRIELKDRKVRMLPMDRSICPQAICSDTGWIGGGPKSIICLPNRLIVSFESDKNSDIDGIVF